MREVFREKPFGFGYEYIKFVAIEILATGKKSIKDTINAPSWVKSIVGRFDRRIHTLLASFADVRTLWKIAIASLYMVEKELPCVVLLFSQCLPQYKRLLLESVNFSRFHVFSIA